ncbi:MAG: tetratricopeptide repeat protein [Spirochaetia bacterium]|nr:tetratricopeptide repeat protein [Spirochaetia bacterium]
MKKISSLVIAGTLAAVLSAQGRGTGRTAIELFADGQELQAHKQWFDAMDLYQEALSMNPQYGDAWYNMALCSYALGSYDLCVQYADNAAKYERNLSDIQNLKGMAMISLGKIDEAKNVFTAVLKKYPNNIDARFGLAELDLLDGRISVAEGRYLDALKRDSQNRKALLSLALVSSEMGKNEAAEQYVKQALSYYSGEAEVHYMASYLAAKNGDYKVAEQRARSAVQINGDLDKAYSLLAQILFAQKRYDEVIDICDFRIGRKRDCVGAWYLKGLSQQKLERYYDAIDTYQTGLTINPQDEVMRNALELLVGQVLPVEDPRRNSWAEYHSKKAAEFGRNFDGISERYEYQRALSVAPLNASIRQSFADMLERDGLYELYLQQLKFIKENAEVLDNGPVIQRDENSPSRKRSREQIKNDDAIENYESIMRNNISARWKIDPFYLDKTRWNIGIYYTKKPVQLFHADLEEISALAARTAFSGVPSTAVDVETDPVASYGEAFRLARTQGRDYFVIMTAEETERTYSIDATIYSARTGTKTSEIHVYRTGNDCMAKSLQRFRAGVLDILPIRGKVLQNVQGTLLLDLGKNDGISVDAEFNIIRKGGIETNDEGPGIKYNKKDLLGTVKVTACDEEISEGKYRKNGFYDTLNVGDEIILVKNKDGDKKDKDGNAATDSRPAADSEGKAATEAAAAAEKEAIKESLKPVSRENDLIHLIREIL